MFAKQAWDSDSPGYDGRSYISFPGKRSPVGQAIVKQSWVPEEVTAKSKRSVQGLPQEILKRDGRSYRAARKGELFIMYKLDPRTPGTDEGWVYGTVTADGKKVTSAGLVTSCVNCHQDAPHDRLFGLAKE